MSTVVKTPLASSQSPGGVPYANARIRAARQRLLSTDEARAYLDEPNFESFFKRLSKGPYGDALTTALLTQSGVEAASVALASSLRKAYTWVYGLCDKHFRKLLTALVAKWDVNDLKTIIRAKASGEALSSERTAFMGIGVQISPEEIRALIRQESLEDVVNLILTWGLPYGQAFSEGLEAYMLKPNVADFELRLDKAYTTWACTQIRGVGEAAKYARRVFGQGIDTLNIDTLIRLADTPPGEVEDPLSYVLPGGYYLNNKLFELLMEEHDLHEMITLLKKSIPDYGGALTEGYGNYELTGHLSEIERALEVRLTRQTIKEGARDILGFGVVLSYLTAKERETTNLGIIAHGVYRGVAPGVIEKDLTLV